MGRRTNKAPGPAQVSIHYKRLDLAKVIDARARLQHRRARMCGLDLAETQAAYFEDLAAQLRSFDPVRIPGRLLSSRFRVKNELTDYVLLADGRFRPG